MTNDPIFGIFGAAGFGREIMPVARAVLKSARWRDKDIADRLVFIDDALHGSCVNGHRVLSREQFLNEPSQARAIAIAIADSRVRARITEDFRANGIQPWTIRAENAVIMDNVEIGPGSILSPFVTLTSNIRIGVAFHANLYSYVGHDCRIGDFVTFAPGVKCNGNVVVEDLVYIGAGAIIKQGKPNKPLVIGKAAVVGMGAVVTKDVPPGAVVVGNPARPIRKSTTT